MISNLEPYHDQNVEEFPQTLPIFHPTCYSRDENSFAYDSTPNLVKDSPNIFNPTSQPPMYSYEFCGDNAHYSYDCPPQILFIYDSEPGPRETSQCQQVIFYDPCCENCGGPHENVQCQPMNYYEPNPCYNYSGFDNFQPSQPVIDHLNLQQRTNDSMIELCGMFQAWLQQRKDQVCQKNPHCYDNDNDEESSITLKDIFIFKLPPCIAITPVVSTKDSLVMGDEHLDTIPEKESDEIIKSSVENLVPNNDNESFFDEEVSKEIYSNPLFDKEIISIKKDPHHLNAEFDLIESQLNQDSLIISSSKIYYLLEEFSGELILLKSIPPGIDEADYDPEEEIRVIEKLLDEINLSLTLDDSMPPGIENNDYDSEGDILILEELLSNDSLSLPKNESFHFDIPSSPRFSAKPPDNNEIKPNSGILTVKVVGDISEHCVPIPRLFPSNPPLLQIRRNLLISHIIGALKLFSFLLKAR
nr:hypothetical protein [Tanacetum cinerariifolium]